MTRPVAWGQADFQLPAMRVLVAPDCYGDSLSAVEAAAAIATGWTRSRPGDSFIVAPNPMAVRVLLRCWAAG